MTKYRLTGRHSVASPRHGAAGRRGGAACRPPPGSARPPAAERHQQREQRVGVEPVAEQHRRVVDGQDVPGGDPGPAVEEQGAEAAHHHTGQSAERELRQDREVRLRAEQTVEDREVARVERHPEGVGLERWLALARVDTVLGQVHSRGGGSRGRRRRRCASPVAPGPTLPPPGTARAAARARRRRSRSPA